MRTVGHPSLSPDPGGGRQKSKRRNDMLQYDMLATWLRARFGDSERGASLVEYALLVALIAVVCIAAVTILGKNASNKFNSVGSSISG
jgi:pilus assembly protein Flp/PilA